MAASAAFTAVAGPSSLEFSVLPSKSAFGSSCNVVQGVPMARFGARLGAIRASSKSSEETQPARREVLASILAAGAALSFSSQASAVPSLDTQNLVEEAGSSIKRRIDGLFGKDKPYPQRDTQVTGKGPIADAKNRVGNFLDNSQNPLATNVEKAAQDTASGLATVEGPNSASSRASKEFLGKDSTRVDEATARVNDNVNKLQGKVVEAFGDTKSAAKDVVGAAKDAAPEASNVQTPNPSDLFNSLGNKLDSVKGDIASKADNAKDVLPGQ